MDSAAATSKILMIGSLNLANSLRHAGSRGSGVSRFEP
jgi:hypothetical protein